MIEYACTVVAVAVFSALVVVIYYRICHPAKFWAVVASWHRAIGRHIANERYILDVRAGLARQAAATGAAKPANAGKTKTATVIDNGVEWKVEERA